MERKKILYHYTTASIALGFILNSGRLRFNSFGQMRDPKEMGDLSLSQDLYREYFDKGEDPTIDTKWKNYDEAKARLKELRNREWYLACFSQDAPDAYLREDYDSISAMMWDYVVGVVTGWGIPSMWVQYADNHQGCCLAFDKAKLISEFRTVADTEFPDAHIWKNGSRVYDASVAYDDMRLLIEHQLPHNFLNPVPDGILRQSMLDDKERLFFLKAKCFRGESEYRFLIHVADTTHAVLPQLIRAFRDQTSLYLPFGASLDAVYLGLRTSKMVCDLIEKHCSKVGLNCYQLEWNNGLPKVEIIK